MMTLKCLHFYYTCVRHKAKEYDCMLRDSHRPQISSVIIKFTTSWRHKTVFHKSDVTPCNPMSLQQDQSYLCHLLGGFCRHHITLGILGPLLPWPLNGVYHWSIELSWLWHPDWAFSLVTSSKSWTPAMCQYWTRHERYYPGKKISQVPTLGHFIV